MSPIEPAVLFLIALAFWLFPGSRVIRTIGFACFFASSVVLLLSVFFPVLEGEVVDGVFRPTIDRSASYDIFVMLTRIMLLGGAFSLVMLALHHKRKDHGSRRGS